MSAKFQEESDFLIGWFDMICDSQKMSSMQNGKVSKIYERALKGSYESIGRVGKY